MSAYPTEHVPTRKQTIEEIKAFVAAELNEVTRAIDLSSGRTVVTELVAERNAFHRVMRFLVNLR